MLPDDVSRAESRGDGRAGLLTGMLWSGPRGTQDSSECVEGRGWGGGQGHRRVLSGRDLESASWWWPRGVARPERREYVACPREYDQGIFQKAGLVRARHGGKQGPRQG